MIRNFFSTRRVLAVPGDLPRQPLPQRNSTVQPAGTLKCRCVAGSESRPSDNLFKDLIKARRARAEFFGAHLFNDPAWDILLETYVSDLDEEPLLISTLLYNSLVPATSMLRWIKVLVSEGWVETSKDDLQAPQVIVKLSNTGRRAMWRYLAANAQTMSL